MPASATAPRISGRHQANRDRVVADIAAFLLQHYATAGTYAETVEAALNRACELDDAEFFALGILTGHYRKSRPEPDTLGELLTHLERLLPVTTDAPGRPDGSARLNATLDAADRAAEALADPFANLPKF